MTTTTSPQLRPVNVGTNGEQMNAEPLLSFTGAPIVETRLKLAVYVREKAGKLEVVIDDKTETPAELSSAFSSITTALDKRLEKRRVERPAVRFGAGALGV